MSNYTTENLISAAAQQGVPAIRVGSAVFPLTISSGGVDVSSTTAEAGDVLSGKVLVNSGGVMISGTIPIISGGTITPTTSDQIISSGVYLGGSQAILGDENLVASNIVSGTSIFGVSGTAQAGGEVYLCVSASKPVQFNLIGDTYGGTYVYDGQLDGRDVYTNGDYYVIYGSRVVPYNDPARGDWYIYSSRSWEANLEDGIHFALNGLMITSGGQVLAWQPENVTSGTWSGREMVPNSVGYYEPVSSGSETSLIWSGMVPEGGQMYNADATQHVDQMWNYDYKRDIKALVSSTTDELHPDAYADMENVTGPDEDGWFSFGEGAYVTYSGENWETGSSLYSAKRNSFTLAFKFKFSSYNTEDARHNTIASISNVNVLITTAGKLAVDPFQDGYTTTAAYNPFGGRYTESDLTLQADTEYQFVVTCDQSRFRVVVNGILRIDLRSASYYADDRITSVSLRQWSEESTGVAYAYKDLSLWGRVMNDLAAYSSASIVYSGVTATGSDLPGPGIISGLSLTGGRFAVYDGGLVRNAVCSAGGLYILSGGTADTVTVSSGGTLVVYSGGTALNVTSETDAVVVNSGGSLTRVNNQL